VTVFLCGDESESEKVLVKKVKAHKQGIEAKYRLMRVMLKQLEHKDGHVKKLLEENKVKQKGAKKTPWRRLCHGLNRANTKR
jgi:hypothetical protein